MDESINNKLNEISMNHDPNELYIYHETHWDIWLSRIYKSQTQHIIYLSRILWVISLSRIYSPRTQRVISSSQTHWVITVSQTWLLSIKHVTAHCLPLAAHVTRTNESRVCCRMLQCVTVCCSMLQWMSHGTHLNKS